MTARASRKIQKAYAPAAPKLRKITVDVPEDDLALAQAFTGKGVTETVRAGLKKLASIRAQRELVRYRGKLDLGISVEDMKHDR